jgi:hypothetical protein
MPFDRRYDILDGCIAGATDHARERARIAGKLLTRICLAGYRHADRDFHAHTIRNGQPDSDVHADTDCHALCYLHSHGLGDGYRDRHGDADGYRDRHRHADGNTIVDRDEHDYSQCNADHDPGVDTADHAGGSLPRPGACADPDVPSYRLAGRRRQQH